MINKILTASLSHYEAQRDFIISELDITLNKSTEPGSTNKAIDLIHQLSIANLNISTIKSIIKDNERQINQPDLNSLADLIEQKIQDNQNK